MRSDPTATCPASEGTESKKGGGRRLISLPQWSHTADAKRHFATAGIISADRIVFNIKGNSYRLVVAVDFETAIAFIKWIGTHTDYDRIDVSKVEHGDCDQADSHRSHHEAVLTDVERLCGAKSGSPRGDQLEVLATLIDAYERRMGA